MAKMKNVLDERTSSVVKKAWKYLCSSECYHGSQNDNIFHWFDYESDGGLLKDADALNTLIEPFLLSRATFINPPLPVEEIYERAHKLFLTRESLASAEKSSEMTRNSPYRGFSSVPYLQVDFPGIDYVDSASGLLTLACNIVKLREVTRTKIGSSLNESMRKTAKAAVDFLIEACISKDRYGARWAGMKNAGEHDDIANYADLFFTDSAVTALRAALDDQTLKGWIGPDLCSSVEDKLSMTSIWVDHQYSTQMKSFWTDESKNLSQATQLNPMNAAYALEIVFGGKRIPESPLREHCKDALSSLFSTIKSAGSAGNLMRNYYHVVPNPTGRGTSWYEDRKYIASYLSVLSILREKDPTLVEDSFSAPGEILFNAVIGDWCDNYSGLWESSQPLICYTHDALKGVVQYAQHGRLLTISLGENVIRNVIKEALNSNEVSEIVYRRILEAYYNQR